MATYNSTIRTRIDLDDKKQANKTLKKVPNRETIEAVEELEQGKGSKASSIKDLLDNLNI